MSATELAPALASNRYHYSDHPETNFRWMRSVVSALPLVAILVTQAVLSIRLLRASTASGDEASYIYYGHQLIREFWHGGGSPYAETWLRGAPVIYPILAAMVDHIGGLVLVRLMSSVFMLVATGLLYATARRLFGYWPAITAVGLFALFGATPSLGAYASVDAMSLMLMALAAYSAVRASNNVKWLLIVPVFLLLANATDYSSVLLDPVVIGLAALLMRREGWQRVFLRLGVLALVTAVLLVMFLLLAGNAYLRGVVHTTLAQNAGTGSLNFQSETGRVIISDSWYVAGFVICGVLAVTASLLTARERSSAWLLAVLVLPGIITMLEGLYIKDSQSVIEHDCFGAWFVVIPASYTLARSAELTRVWYARIGFFIPALAGVVLMLYIYNSPGPTGDYYGSPAVFSPVVPYLKASSSQRYLLGDRDSVVILYDYHLAVSWQREFDNDYIKYPIPGHPGEFLTGAAAARAAIRAHWFAVVSLIGQSNSPMDIAELNAIRVTPGYKLISNAGGPTYIYVPDYPDY